VAVRPVVRYPDTVLKRATQPVGTVTDRERALVKDLVDTMRAGPATVGLAAPQVGESVRALVMDVSGHPKAERAHGLVVLFDPELLETHDADVLREGCLSVPDLTANVRRALRVVVRGLDASGTERVYTMEGFEARVLLHELDHLDGQLILDRAVSPSDLFARKVYR
jgi:peptide deformylase